MIYEIAGLRIQINNKHTFTDKFCKNYLSEDQFSPVDLTARVSEEEFLEEKQLSPNFSDGYIENICLYRNICLQIPKFNRILLHSSILQFNGKGYAFLGRSGAGKSTHTRLWLQYLQNTSIINGDKPILKDTEQEFIAYGTPWQGKEGWGERTQASLYGLCFIEQAKQNSIRKLRKSEVVSRLFTQILLPKNEEYVISTLNLVDKLIEKTPAYLLSCDISEEAVKTSFECLTGQLFLENKKEVEKI
jgi:hypothetical protein